MKSDVEGNFFSQIQKILLLLGIIVLISTLLVFKNTFFQSTLSLKSLGKLSMNPEVAFVNKKPTFLEFYAEWCEICKEMAPNIVQLRNDYGDDINFVFLNVDNPKWEKYIKEFNVNGIPQINLFNSQSKINTTFIGLQDEIKIKNALSNLKNDS
tara:strand:- start:2006 stop:2467 length:462 start_codon:yes stop_codon:yes gene_type:complete